MNTMLASVSNDAKLGKGGGNATLLRDDLARATPSSRHPQPLCSVDGGPDHIRPLTKGNPVPPDVRSRPVYPRDLAACSLELLTMVQIVEAIAPIGCSYSRAMLKVSIQGEKGRKEFCRNISRGRMSSERWVRLTS